MVVLKELIFNSFYLWKCVAVLKELIFNSFYFGRWCGVPEKNSFFTVPIMGGCDSFERALF